MKLNNIINFEKSLHMRKISIFFMLLILCNMLCGCATKQADVVKAAFKAENYQQVIELLDGTEIADPELQYMLSISKAYTAYDAQEYEEAVSLLDTVADGMNYCIYSDAMNILCQRAFNSRDIPTLVTLINKDDSLSDYVYHLVTEKCATFDYNTFLFLDELTTALPEGNLKTRLSEYSTENASIRAKSFLLGEWEWQQDVEVKTRVKTYLYAGSKVLGEISVVGTTERSYQYSENELYWKDFEFVNDADFTCYHMLKSSYGTLLPHTANGHIDYENDVIYFSFGNPNEGTYFVNPERLWTKVG